MSVVSPELNDNKQIDQPGNVQFEDKLTYEQFTDAFLDIKLKNKNVFEMNDEEEDLDDKFSNLIETG